MSISFLSLFFDIYLLFSDVGSEVGYHFAGDPFPATVGVVDSFDKPQRMREVLVSFRQYLTHQGREKVVPCPINNVTANIQTYNRRNNAAIYSSIFADARGSRAISCMAFVMRVTIFG